MKPSDLTEIKIDSFNRFIKTIEDLSSVSVNGNRILSIYRGQEEDWPLLPKIGRNTEWSKEEILEKERNIFDEFKRLSYPHLDSNLDYDDDLSMLALAQHHGLPTRLLDWTGNPLVALWFAFIKKKKKLKTKMKPRVVWCFFVNEDGLYKNGEDTPIFDNGITNVFRPKHVTKRITSQSGWFTIHRFQLENKMIPLNEQMTYNGTVIKINIPEKCRNDILNKLDIIGINNFSLFPDLEGLSHYLEWKTIDNNIRN